MAYTHKKFILNKKMKAWQFLVQKIHVQMKEAQKIIDRKQLFCNDILVERKSNFIEGDITLLVYEPNPKGILPIYENNSFAVFEKPSGVLTHPRNRKTSYSLNDEIKHLYGKNANVVHRLDKETSGLIIVSKDKFNERELKKLFESREVEKKYIALVKGKLDGDFFINEPILTNNSFEIIKLKVHINENGKKAITHVRVLEYFEDIDATLVEAIPKTGRQHQIRVHMFHVKHCIIGDPLYGQTTQNGAMFLDGLISEDERIKLTGAPRVLLHANEINFIYDGKKYNFKSKFNARTEFHYLAKKKLK